MDFPKWVYSKDSSVLVSSKDELDALGDGFYENPWEPKGEDQDGNKLEVKKGK